jgi:hypothetical protein
VGRSYLISRGSPTDIPTLTVFPHFRANGLGLGSPSLDLWPVLLEQWLRGRVLLTAEAAVNK